MTAPHRAPRQDRTVHAECAGVGEIVRYDRAGVWYFELGGKRTKLTVAQAAERAANVSWRVHYGLPGGQRFDLLVRERREAAS